MIVSVLYVRFRDVSIIWTLLATVLFYATPVLYPIEAVPEQYGFLIRINPLTPIFEQMRTWVVDPSAPGALTSAGGWLGLLPAIAIFASVCVIAVWLFRREAPRIAEDL